MPTQVQDRRDLARYLQAQMAASRWPWPVESDAEVEAAGRAMVKTYLLEAHRNNDAREVLVRVGTRAGFAVSETQDPDLFVLRSGEHELWCDTSIERFWRLHTVAMVKDADRLRTQLVTATPDLDNVWLPSAYLERLAAVTDSQMQTFSLNHDRRLLHGKENEPVDFEYVTLRLWASKAAEKLQKLRRAQIFPHGVSVRSVRLRSGSVESEGDYCVAEYFHRGKVTASGNSFDEHNRLIVKVLNDYAAIVRSIEEKYGIGYVDDERGHVHLSGRPIVIEMEWTVQDLEGVVGRMFASVEPFRLWGLPERLGNDHYRARAVDLHVGSTLTFDITRDHIVIQLPRGTCGNTVVRFLGGLHYHVNSDVGTGLLA